MILPPELQKYIYVLDDAPYALEAIVRYCALHHDTLMGLESLFGLDVPATQLDKDA